MRTTTWQYIFSLLCFLGVFTTVAIVGMLYWMTERINQAERDKTHALIELKLSETAQQLRLAVEDYAHWDLAHDLVQAGDSEGIYDNLGSGATDSDLFDQLFFVDAQGTLLYAFDETLGTEAEPLFSETVLQSVWPELSDSPPADHETFVTFFENDGSFSFLAAAWIAPDDVADRPDEQYAALLGVVHLDNAQLTGLRQNAQVNDMEIVPYATVAFGETDANPMTLSDLRGAPVAALKWSIYDPGTRLRNELLPGVLIMALGILGICGAAARYFRAQHKTLQRANRVATTDQLTGLLNRAGLAEELRRKEMQTCLEKGHMAVLYLDLNKFKELNDTFGHLAGDIALRVTAERLQSAVRSSDIVARMGGDEFVCVIIDANAENAALQVAQRIVELSKSTFAYDDHKHLIRPSVGIAVASAGTQWETVLAQSDAAMYQAKQDATQRPVVFCKSLDAGNRTAEAAE